jgi:hypothetical protein
MDQQKWNKLTINKTILCCFLAINNLSEIGGISFNWVPILYSSVIPFLLLLHSIYYYQYIHSFYIKMGHINLDYYPTTLMVMV